MARYKLQGRARDTWGNTITGLDIYVYVAGTSRTQDAIVYTSSTSTTAISAAPQISSDTYGFFNFWVDDTDYTASTTKFDIFADGLEYTYIDIFNIKNHSILSGLPRNDHPQYTAASAAEVITGTWYFSTPASGATPSAGMHLVNKDYVDTSVASISAGEGLVESPANVLNVNPGNGIEITFDAVTVKQDELTHANISGLGADDHTQYSRVDGTRAFTGAVGGITPTADEHLVTKLYLESNYPSAAIPSAGGPIIVTNNWYFTVPVSGVSPSADNHLAIKQYVDNAVLSVSAGGGLIEPQPNVFAVNPDGTTIQIVSDEVAVIQGGLDHVNIQNIGTNTHAEIDSSLLSIEASAADLNTQILSVSAAVGEEFLRQDGTTPLEGNWDAGPYDILVGGDVHISGSLFTSGASIYTTAIHPLTSPSAAINITDGGPVELYYNGVKSVETYNKIGAGGGYGINLSDGKGLIYSNTAGTNMDIKSIGANNTGMSFYVNDSGGAEKLSMHLQHNGGIRFYNNDILTVALRSGGLYYKDATSTNSIYTSGTTFIVRGDTVGTNVLIDSKDLSGSYRNILHGDPDGSVSLYTSGAKVLETLTDGVQINAEGELTHDGTDFIIENTTVSGNIKFTINDGNPKQRGYIRATQQQFGNAGQTEVFLDTTNSDMFLRASGNDYIYLRDRGTHHIEFWTNSKIAMDMDDGSVDLYYDGVKVFETYGNPGNTQQGFEIGDFTTPASASEISRMYQSGSQLTFKNDYHNGSILFQGESAAGATSRLLALKVAGSTLYNDDVAALLIQDGGFQAKAADGSNSLAIQSFNGGSMIRNQQNNGYIVLQANSSAAPFIKNILRGYANGTTELYYDGVKVFETTTEGIEIGDGTDTASIGFDQSIANELQIYNLVNSGTVEIRGKNSGGVLTPLANFDPDGGSIIRANGHDIFSVGANSITITDQANDALDIAPGAAAVIASRYDGGTIQIEGDDSNGVDRLMFHGDPDGSVSLYTSGAKVFETRTDGVTIGNGIDTAHIRVDGSGHFHLENQGISGAVLLQATNSGAALRTLFSGDPDGGVSLYHTANNIASTYVNGTIGGLLVRGVGGGIGYFWVNPSDNTVTVRNESGGNVILQGNSGGAINMLEADPLLGVSLQYGVAVNEISNDTTLTDASPSALVTEYAVKTFVLAASAARDEHNELKSIQGGIPSASEYYHLSEDIYNGLFSASPTIGMGTSGGSSVQIDYGGGGEVQLYESTGSKVFETTNIGVDLFGATASSQLEIREAAGGNWDIVNKLAGNGLTFRITNGLSVEQSGIAIDNPGNQQRVVFYYNGAAAFSSAVGGMAFADGLGGLTKSGGNVYLKNTTHGGLVEIHGENTTGNLATLIASDPDGAAELYYAGSKALETTEYGFTAYASGGDTILEIISGGIKLNTDYEISHDGTNAFIRNNTDGGDIYLQANDTGSIRQTLLHGSPDGSVRIFHDSFPRLETSTVGDGGIIIRNDSNQIFDMYWSGSTFYIDNDVDSAHIVIRGENAASANTTMALFDPDGAVDLYYAGVKAASTSSQGFVVTEAGTDSILIFNTGNSAEFYSYTHGDLVSLRGENLAGAAKYILQGDPDFGTTLYYAGISTFQTQADGALIGTGDEICRIGFNSDILTITNTSSGGEFRLISTDLSDVEKIVFNADPDGRADLYYAGNSIAHTSVSGFDVDAGLFTVGSNGTTQGGIVGYGAATNNGGYINLYTAADSDDVIDRYDISVYQDDLRIGPFTDIDALKYDGGLGKWLMDGQTGGVELLHAGNKKFETTSTGASITGDLEYLNISTVTSATTASNSDVILASGGPYTVSLEEKDRAIIRVKYIDSGNTITVEGLSGTIDGSANITLTSQYESVTVVSDGTNWFII